MKLFSLHMNGRKVTFSQEELLAKLEKLEKMEKEMQVEEADTDGIYEEAQRPTVGKYFKIVPSSINEALFKDKRTDFMQEWTRKTIVCALNETKKHPQRYRKTFVTFMPKKSWKSKTVSELKAFAESKSGHVANWVEQALEWAQRITNGEAWENICNIPDTANWYRLIIWKDEYAKIVGGSQKCGDSLPACTVFGNQSSSNDVLYFTIPLIVLYL